MSVSVTTPPRARRTRMISPVAVQHTLIAIFACTLAAYATVDATTTQDIGAPRFPPSDPARVQILRVEPQRAHDRLGDIVVDASTDPAPPIEKIEAKLRDEASKLGADAVVVVYDRVQPTAAYVRPSVGSQHSGGDGTEGRRRGDQVSALGQLRSICTTVTAARCLLSE